MVVSVGDHLVSPRTGFTHHGIVVEEGQVVHYRGFKKGECHTGPVEEVSLSEFADGRDYRVRAYDERRFSREESAQRARSKIGEECYCVFSNNCEHFIEWCINGDHRSSQVDTVASVAPVVTGGAAITVGVTAVTVGGVVAGVSGPGVMSGLASAGVLVGGGAVAGLGVLAGLPGVVSAAVLNHTVLKDNPAHDDDERFARQGARVATLVGAGAGTVGTIAAVSVMGTTAGLSGAGIASGLAAIGSATGAGSAAAALGVGGAMVGGVAVTVAAPAVAATAIGYGAYKFFKWLTR